jgi:serine/threonine protein phosphatase 1
MSRTLVIGDIHGSYKALRQILERASVTPDDLLIFLGDYVDGWGQSPEVIDLLMQLKESHQCIFMRGNHDDLLMTWLKTKEYNELWFNHGGRVTTECYNKLECDIIDKQVVFLEGLHNYYLDQHNRLFVHAGFTSLNGVMHEHFKRMFFWDRTLWETALAMDPLLTPGHPQYPKRLTHYKEIFIGHTPVTRIGKTVPVRMANVWNVDTGAAFKGPLTIMDADTKQYWQSDPVYLLHPEEIGRND